MGGRFGKDTSGLTIKTQGNRKSSKEEGDKNRRFSKTKL